MSQYPFRYFKTSPEIIQLAVMMYVRFPLSLRNVEDLLHERGIDICHETVWQSICRGSGACEVCRNSPQSIRQYTITLMSRGMSTLENDLNRIETLRFVSGATFSPLRTCWSANYGDWFEFV